jgi:PleD family two-component response regulator
VRAALIKHIEGMFEFREAHDGEQAWEALLLDPNIRVVITDLTMPKLDGYGLLHRIRSSKVSRIRNIPVVVVSGSDEQEERDRVKAAGATDLITKGIGTANLLSRLDILSKLVSSQREYERGLEALVRAMPSDSPVELLSPETLRTRAEATLENAIAKKKNFVILNIRVGLRPAEHEGGTTVAPGAIVSAVGELLRRSVRQTDCVAKTGEAEFTIATGSIHFDAARCMANRLCRAIANASLVTDEQISFIASCGMDSLSDYKDWTDVTLQTMRETAYRRALLGMDRVVIGVVGPEDEGAIERGEQWPPAGGEVAAEPDKEQAAEAGGRPADLDADC